MEVCNPDTSLARVITPNTQWTATLSSHRFNISLQFMTPKNNKSTLKTILTKVYSALLMLRRFAPLWPRRNILMTELPKHSAS